MTRRTAPAELVGAVAVFAPTPASPYYRLKWREPDGTPGDTTGGRTLDGALVLAADIDDRLAAAAGPHAVATLATMVKAYLQEARSPYKDKKAWKDSQRLQATTHLNRMLREHGHLRAMDVTAAVCDTMRAQAGTPNVVRSNTTHLRAFLTWGSVHEPRYFTPQQAQLLPLGAPLPAPALRGTAAPARREDVRRVGEAEEYVADEDAPSAAEVSKLSRALGCLCPQWGELAPELAANCGPRWGEQFQLTSHDVHLEGCAQHQQPHIHVRWQVNPGGSAKDPLRRRCRPKGNKTRLIPIPSRSFTGYPLREAVRARVAAALAEQQAGTNPEALLFPAVRGGLLWYSGFEADLLRPAMRQAGWPLKPWTQTHEVWSPTDRKYHLQVRQRTLAVKPWHSLRHRFARLMVDVHRADKGVLMALGGWESLSTVEQRYYRTGDEHTARGLELFA